MHETEARISLNWGARMLLAGVAFLGFGIWALYDGFVKYPTIEETFQDFIAEYRIEQWVPYAREHGLPTEYKLDSATGRRYIKSDWDIYTQHIMAAVCLPIGMVILGRLLWMMPKRLKSDDDGVVAANGTRIPYDRITFVNRDKWDRKGIAVVFYEDSDGRERRAKIDDWIFKGGKEILQAIEERVPPEVSGLEPLAEGPDGVDRDAEPDMDNRSAPEPGGGDSQRTDRL